MNHSTQYWTRTRKAVWLVLGSLICMVWGYLLVCRVAPPKDGRLNDFVQEWTSAKNYFAGMPIYQNLGESVAHHLGPQYAESLSLDYNAHPPVAVMMALPFGQVDFRTASVIWNILCLVSLAATLAMIFSRYGCGYSFWGLLPVVAVLLPSSPLAHHVILVQINLILLGLITAAWLADRNRHPWLSGTLVAFAASIKLFPAFLFLYFIARRQWRSLVAGLVTVVGLHATAMMLFGAHSFQTYVSTVVPTVGHQFRAGWQNASLLGLFSKLFGNSNDAIIPLWTAPSLAPLLFILCGLGIAIVLFRKAWQAQSREQTDQAMMACVIGMVLLSPVAWHHYFLLLILPLLVLWPRLYAHPARRVCLVGLVILFALNPHWIMDPVVPGDGEHVLHPDAVQSVATPLHVVTVLSYQCYCLVGFLLMTLLSWPRCDGSNSPEVITVHTFSTKTLNAKRQPARVAWWAGLQLITLTALTVWASASVYRIKSRQALPELRVDPLVVEPQYNMPQVVSDEQLSHVLTRLLPRFRETKAPVSTVDHALRMWGLPATFDDPSAMSGKEMRRMLIDHHRFTEIHGESAKPLLNEVNGGVRYRTQEGIGSSSHYDHTLACLSEVGTSLDFPVRTSERETTVRAIMEQALRDFSLNQFEYEWSALVFALHVKSPGRWVTKDGQEIDFDMIADRIMRQELPQGVCRGMHRMHALVMLLRVNEQSPILSLDGAQRIEAYLRGITDLLMRTQHIDGYWEGDWHTGHPSSESSAEENLMDQLLVTGHVLEWWALAPRSVLPPRENIVRAGQWTVLALDRFDDETIIHRYGPLSHAGRALALWRGKFPYQVALETESMSTASKNKKAAKANTETVKERPNT